MVRVSRERWKVPPRQITPVALVLVITVAGFVVARLVTERDAQRHSERRAEVAVAQIEGRVGEGVQLTESLRRFMLDTARRTVTNGEFERNASRWLSPTGFPASGWAEQVPASRRTAYERRSAHPIVASDTVCRVGACAAGMF